MASFINAKELKYFLKIPESTIYEMSANGEIPGYRLGPSWMLDFGRMGRFMDKEKINRLAETLLASFVKLKRPKPANA
jgi:hypothetical protein